MFLRKGVLNSAIYRHYLCVSFIIGWLLKENTEENHFHSLQKHNFLVYRGIFEVLKYADILHIQC